MSLTKRRKARMADVLPARTQSFVNVILDGIRRVVQEFHREIVMT